jgi:hypothetical protein
MTDLALSSPFQAAPRHGARRLVRSGRPIGVLGAIRYGGVLLVWLALLVVRPSLALTVFRERRADSPIPRFRR